ncbi:glycoside hydrolase family 65 protein [Enterococcus sp.]|uniref:glycoside hydrolase family 65 protein n=1 Tax=Enterococcus sp. TaxID=35783 RepID=UPI003C71C831
MKLTMITITSQGWQVQLPSGNQQQLTDLPQANAKSLFTIIQSEPTDGGILYCELPEIITFPEGTFELSQWLTENLNLPFLTNVKVDEFPEKAADLCWHLDYYGYRPGKDEYSVESLLTVGNGYLGLRGTTPEMEISDDSYPATYLASLYNTAYSQVQDRTIANEDFVNAPNLQKIYLIIDGEKVAMSETQVTTLHRSLDMRNGLMTSRSQLSLVDGRSLTIETAKFASMAQRECYSLRYRFTPDFDGTIQVVTEADGTVYNYNVARYRSLENRHLDVLKTAVAGPHALLAARTKDSHITVLQESFLRSPLLETYELQTEITDEKVFQSLTIEAHCQQWYELEKTIHVTQYRPDEEQPALHLSPENPAERFPDFSTLLDLSAAAWQVLWDNAAINVTGDFMSQKLLNLHTYHLLSSASPIGNVNLDASVTARGLHGEAYRGHIFWDELFILPFYILRFPETARQLLLYRYHRLPAAKTEAQKAGYQGAMFPWQSGLDGTEQSQELHLNPISGEWKEDHSRRQRHVSLAIAYNVWFYWHNTEDHQFMKDYGLELILEIAQFWQSIATFDPTTKRYGIAGVMGPDEFHEAYPGAEKGGLKDNAYTNMMVVWLFEELANLKETFGTEVFQQIQAKTGVTDDLVSKMEKIRHQLTLDINPDGIIAQFDGYFDLLDLDWDHYRAKYGNVYRLDRILNAEGLSADDYKVAKQADSLMIYYNFSKNQVEEILQDLGYREQLPEDYVSRNLHYYLARTSHGSTLSRVVHAQLAAMVDEKELAWELYQEALYSDYRDIQGGTTAEGIHAGVMAATLYIPLTTFAGLDVREEVIHINPNLPAAWSAIAYHITVKNVNYYVKVTTTEVILTTSADTRVIIKGKEVPLTASEQLVYPYHDEQNKN